MKKGSKGQSVAYVVSPHGFGHAARACSIMEALWEKNSRIRFEVYTRVPAWFFHDSLGKPFGYHDVMTDVGLVQKSPFQEDVAGTVRALEDYFPFNEALLDSMAVTMKASGCRLAVCDISPLGIGAAARAGIPSVLVENFTWDWIYAGYAREDGRMAGFASSLKDVFGRCSSHIQTEPVCVPASPDLVTAPVSRRPRLKEGAMRERLGIPAGSKMVTVTMGGVRESFRFLRGLKRHAGVYFVIPGGSETLQREDNLVLIPFHSDYYHPDLIQASDAVIGKAGYSTLAEAFHAGVPFMYVTRAMFRESEVLDIFVRRHMRGVAVTGEEYAGGGWVSRVPELLSLERYRAESVNGAAQAADFISRLL
jgi:hypothetical protein